MVATGYYVERAVLMTASCLLLAICSYVTFTVYNRVKGSLRKNYLKFLLAVLCTAAAIFLVIENVDYECAFGIYDPYGVATLNHNAASFIFFAASVLTIQHLELVYKFMRVPPPPNIRRIGFACGFCHWVIGNLCMLLLVVTKNEIFLGLFFLMYVVAVVVLILFVNLAVRKVVNTVEQHVKGTNLTTAPELEKVIRQSRTFQLGETVVCVATAVVLGMRVSKHLHSRALLPGVTNPMYMDPDVYSFSAELTTAIILGDFVANIWMFVGERQAAKNGSKDSKGSKSSKPQSDPAAISGGKSFRSVISHDRAPSSKNIQISIPHNSNHPIAPPSPINSSALHPHSSSGGGGRVVSKNNDIATTSEEVEESRKMNDLSKARGSPLLATGRALKEPHISVDLELSHSHTHDGNKSSYHTDRYTTITSNNSNTANRDSLQQPDSARGAQNDALTVVVVADLIV